jgi:CRP/FNR family transcriptional regulator, dissimilatory nitrate respiration regulator
MTALLVRPVLVPYDPDHMAPNISVFSPDNLAAHLLAALPQSRVIRRRVGRGETIFRQGDPAVAVFVVESGRIRLVRMLADGTPLILYVAETGESFAEASLSAAHYHCDAVAETDTVVRLHASGSPPVALIRRSWTEIADELGLTREAVYRALARLEHQKLVSRHAGVVCLTTAPE